MFYFFLLDDFKKLTICCKYISILFIVMALASIQQNDMITSQPVGQVQTNVSGQSFTVGQSWGALRKAWKGYRIAKVQNDDTKMNEYANKIRKIQGELNIALSSFPNLGIS